MINRIKEKVDSSKFKNTLKIIWKVLRIPVYVATVAVLYFLAMQMTTLSINNFLEDSSQYLKNMTSIDSVLRAYTVPIMIGLLFFKGAFILHKKLHYFIFTRPKEVVKVLPVNGYVTDFKIKAPIDFNNLEISIGRRIEEEVD